MGNGIVMGNQKMLWEYDEMTNRNLSPMAFPLL